MKKAYNVIGAVVLSLSMVVTAIPGNTEKAEAASDYVYDDSYSLGWANDKIAVYKGGTSYQTVEESGIPVYDKSGDNPFASEIDQAWNAEKLILTRPVQYTTDDGKVHDVESMLTGFDFIADPTAIDNSTVDGKLYVYGTTEGFTYNGGTMANNGYDNHSLTILSSSDMVNWTDEGFMDTQNLENEVSTADNKTKAGWAVKAWAPSGLAFDGDGDGKDEYYLFHTNSGAVGYVMSDSPTGPWKDPLQKTLFAGIKGVKWCFDPAVLRDDKGDAYVYFGGGIWDGNDAKTHPDGIARPKTGRVCKLGFDENGEVYADGEPQEMNTFYLFEDSEINQFNGKYYYSYCANFQVPGSEPLVKSGSIAVYVSSDPMDIAFDPYDGDHGKEAFTEDGIYHHYLGTVLDNPSVIYGQSYNNHHHMQEFRGHKYILYHSTELNNALHHSSHSYRNLHVDEITVDPDTDEIECNPSYEGPEQVGNYNLYKNTVIDKDGKEQFTDKKIINATTTSYSAGVKSYRSDAMVEEVNNEGTISGGSPMVLDAIDTGDWTKLQGVDFGNGIDKFEAVIASTTTEGAIELFKDDPTKASNMIGKISIKDTGDIEKYETISTTDIDHDVTGVHDLYFVFRGSDYRVASWNFTESTPKATEVPAATNAPATSPAASPAASPSATTAPVTASASPAPSQEAADKSDVDTSKTYKVGKNKYKITDAAAKTVDYAGPAKKNVKSAVIPASVKISGVKYKVTGIAAKAFGGCKKLKTITVKATGIKKVGANAFSGIAARAVIKVPKAKLKTYKKLFKGKGQGKKVKIK